MPLSDIKCRTAKPQAKPYKLTDAKGLYLACQKHPDSYVIFLPVFGLSLLDMFPNNVLQPIEPHNHY